MTPVSDVIWERWPAPPSGQHPQARQANICKNWLVKGVETQREEMPPHSLAFLGKGNFRATYVYSDQAVLKMLDGDQGQEQQMARQWPRV